MKSDAKIVGITFLSMPFWELISFKQQQNALGHGTEFGVYNNKLMKITIK